MFSSTSYTSIGSIPMYSLLSFVFSIKQKKSKKTTINITTSFGQQKPKEGR